jgi:hypothetical protein
MVVDKNEKREQTRRGWGGKKRVLEAKESSATIGLWCSAFDN